MKAAVDFETITAIPVTPLLYEFICLGEVGRDKLVVAKKYTDADERKDDVYSGTETGGLFECSLLRLDRSFLRASYCMSIL